MKSNNLYIKWLLSFTIGLCFYLSTPLKAQEHIQMVEGLGVYYVPCLINGTKVNMIFDTGSAYVSISQRLAEKMLKEGALSLEDFENSQYAILPDGSIVENSAIIIKSLKIGNTELTNIKAVVINNPNALILLGQSAIQKLGKYSINGDILTIYSSSSQQISFENWNPNTLTYTNETYGFSWQLLEGLDWTTGKGKQKQTIFSATGGPFYVFISAEVTAQGMDLWENLDSVDKLYNIHSDFVVQKHGFKIVKNLTERDIHYSNKCLRRYVITSDENGLEYYQESLICVNNNYILTACITANNANVTQYPDVFKEAINIIFSGLTFIK